MAKITAIDFYCDESAASETFKAQLDELGVKYNLLYYNSESHSHETVYRPLRTWSFAEGQFNATIPFVTFMEIKADEPDPRKWPLHFITDPQFIETWLT
jgi:hypothetical protein